MSTQEVKKINQKLAPFMRLLLTVACMGMLASCGGSTTPVSSTKDGESLLKATSSTFMLPHTPGNEIKLSTGEQVELNQIILTRKSNISDAEASTFIAEHNWNIVGYNKYARVYQVQGNFSSELKLNNAINMAMDSGFFKFATVNSLLRSDVVQGFNDPLLLNGDYSWWLNDIKIDSAIKLLGVNNIPVKVGVGDAPFRMDHNDLAFSAIFKSDGVAVDFSRDCPKNIWGQYECYSGSKKYDHGMHVSGIIGSTQNNSTLGAGVAGNRALLVASEIWSTTDQISAITILMEKNVRIINLSQNDRLCVEFANCTVTAEQLKKFKEKIAAKASHIYDIAMSLDPEKRTLFVSSAGNMGEYYLESPIASFPHQTADFNGLMSSFVSNYFSDVIEANVKSFFLNSSLIVGAYNKKRTPSSFSSLKRSEDSAASSIFIMAPGEEIGSLAYNGDNNAMVVDSGTSMATPIISGVAALVMQVNEKLDANRVKNILLDNSESVGDTPAINAEKSVLAALATLQKPTASIAVITPKPTVGGEVIFQANYTSTPNGGISEVQWDFGDGTAQSTLDGSVAQTSHSYTAPGSYTVKLNIKDSKGVTNATNLLITVVGVIDPSLFINFDQSTLTSLGAFGSGYDLITGKDGRPAIKFSGVSNPGLLVIPNSSAMQFTDGATFDLWARIDSLTGMNGYGQTVTDGSFAATLLAKSHDRNGVGFMAGSTGSIWTATYDQTWAAATGSSSTTPPNIPTGTWFRATYTISQTDGIKTYINKTLYSTNPVVGASFTKMNTQDLYLGEFSGYYKAGGGANWYPLNGAIQDVRIYQKALSASEVNSLN